MQYRCISCLKKHLSLCKSFMRQVLDGHGQGGIPDHRIDIQGQIANAEYHSQLIDQVYLLKVRYFRRKLQQNRFVPVEQDLKTIDTLYYYTDKLQGYQIDESIINDYNLLNKTQEKSQVTSSKIVQGCGCNKNKENVEK